MSLAGPRSPWRRLRSAAGWGARSAASISSLPITGRIILQTALFVLIGLISLIVPDSSAVVLQRLGLIAALVYEWFIALVAIGGGPWIAGLVVVIDIVLGLFIQLTALSLY